MERREKQVVVLSLVKRLVTPPPSPSPEKELKELRPFLSIPFCEFDFSLNLVLLILLELKKKRWKWGGKIAQS